MVSLPFPFDVAAAMKKNPELKQSDIEILREWSQKQGHLPLIPDVLFILFLHSNYYNVESAKTTIENYYTIKSHIPEVFNARDPFSKEVRDALRVVGAFPLPGETAEGYRVVYCQLLDADPSVFIYPEASKYFFMIGDLQVVQGGVCPGYVFIGNGTGLAMGHVARFNPTLLRKLLIFIQEAIPVRIKGIHFLHPPPALELILNVAKPFMKKELISMFKFHPTVESLAKCVPIEIIPKDLGGKAASTVEEMHKAQVKQVEDLRSWFAEEEECQRVDESLRIGKSKIANELFGAEGTFKKLEID